MSVARPPDVEAGPQSAGAVGDAAPGVEPRERGTPPALAAAIAASHCARCGRTCAPPARYCPDDGSAMTPTTVPAHGEIVSFTTLYSPPTGFASPLHLALVELSGGAKFFCHGVAGTKGLRLGARVTIEAVDDIYYFSTLSLTGRAALFWRRRAETATGRISAFAKSAAKLLRRTP